ncbi:MULTISPECIES: phage repressor protein CI [Serratia]|uniref:Phage repressor protein CI n=1 Tax=Serratia marcescens TaxID=615 RepID=A0ABD5BC35_SERMA|nr:phage repressor protein CI [Serratia marcescens]MBI6176606.1 phage repressor protein CI [Serratia marcescens]MDQ9440086.1 phage repressor protein CI [Serratia marcescens]MDQ9477018.1 phage repressor protein CI [Serratia marcescens]MDQ9525641.1 phage repressor protein CI [Serratia marcescens]MDQ9534527.1 phage repressor protein CI [Serratia marcescens]
MSKFQVNMDGDSAPILDRVLEAYGFSQKLMLADHLGIASSSLAGRYRRGGFPADIVVRCAAETGVNLEWLATGKGRMYDDEKLDTLTMRRKKLIDGQLFDAGYLMFDKTLILPPKPELIKPFSLVDESNQYIIEQEVTDVFDGEWLLDIEGKISIRTLNRIPIKKVRVSGIGMAFDCAIEDIEIVGRVVLTIR